MNDLQKIIVTLIVLLACQKSASIIFCSNFKSLIKVLKSTSIHICSCKVNPTFGHAIKILWSKEWRRRQRPRVAEIDTKSEMQDSDESIFVEGKEEGRFLLACFHFKFDSFTWFQ